MIDLPNTARIPYHPNPAISLATSILVPTPNGPHVAMVGGISSELLAACILQAGTCKSAEEAYDCIVTTSDYINKKATERNNANNRPPE